MSDTLSVVIGGSVAILICMFGVWRLRVRERRKREEARLRKLDEMRNA